MFNIKYIKEFKIIKGPLRVDKPITSKIDMFEMWPFLFAKII